MTGDYWINAIEHEANVGFLKQRKDLHSLGIPLTDLNNRRVRTETYRGIFPSGKYKIAVNFTAFSDGRAEAKIIGIRSVDDQDSFPSPKKAVIRSDNSMVSVYKQMMDVIETYPKH